MPDANPHPTLTFALDVADKAIKLAAVLLGGVWTWWNYRKSRTYSQKLNIELTAKIFTRGELYVEVNASMRNVGASRHIIEADGTFCTILAVLSDLSELPLHIIPAFAANSRLEPGESANDALYWRAIAPSPNIIWLKFNLQTVSKSTVWYAISLLRIE